VIILACSCDKIELTGVSSYNESGSVDTTIVANDTFLLSFGYFGDEEGIYINHFPEHAEACELLNRQWEERILLYIPDSSFTGSDSLQLVTMRGSDGASESNDVDSIWIRLQIYPDIMKKLAGRWLWQSSCGGFTGSCWYPVKEDSTILEVTRDMNFIKYAKDSITLQMTFTLTDPSLNGTTEVYGFVFGDNPPQWFWFADELLCVQGGDFVENYSRL